VIEAMSFSKPVVGFNIGGITESVLNNENGYLCDPGDLDEMTERIIDLLDSKSKRTKMGNAGLKRIKNLYLAPDRTKDIEDEIIKVLG
ncbi:MAG TPA: glycosyltransferase, partial [Thermodesulfobacteriota bacterium]|nr:glycosyltransferase [Thermodesulfobacteriota bacterium]